MTTLGTRVVETLRRHYPEAKTSAELSQLLGISPRSVASVCCWLRGDGWVDDGSTATRVGNGLAHTPAETPVKWRYLWSRDEAPLNRVFHGRPVEPLK